ncbi:PREDICTED: neuritin [Calidris pugnax]|nr:PREDICTED: neuritin [Calidris pugnax]
MSPPRGRQRPLRQAPTKAIFAPFRADAHGGVGEDGDPRNRSRGQPPRELGGKPVFSAKPRCRLLSPSCRYWDDFHACTLTALTDCQEGATDLWEKLRRESKNLDFQGSLFELCGGGSGAAPSLLPPALPLLLAALWAALVTWLPF